MAPKDVHVLVPGCGNFYGKGDFADMIKIWVLREAATLVAQCHLRGPYQRKAGRGFRGRGRDVTTETEAREMGDRKMLHSGFEDRGRGHESQNAGASRSWKRRGNRFAPRAPRRNAVLPAHFRLPTPRTRREHTDIALSHYLFQQQWETQLLSMEVPGHPGRRQLFPPPPTACFRLLVALIVIRNCHIYFLVCGLSPLPATCGSLRAKALFCSLLYLCP